MNEFTTLLLAILMLVNICFFTWLIIQCKSLSSGTIVMALAIAASYGIKVGVSYIAIAIAWVLRFGAVFLVLAFVLGIFPRRKGGKKEGRCI